MADEVGRFVASIEADPSGLSDALAKSAAEIKQFADTAQADFDRANAAVTATTPLSNRGLQIGVLTAQYRELARTIALGGEETVVAFRASAVPLTQQLLRLGATQSQLGDVAKAISTVEQRYIAMAVAARTAAQAQSSGTPLTQATSIAVPTVTSSQVAGIAGVAEGLGNVAVNSGRAGISLDRLRLPLTTIADHALGANRAFGALSSGILSIGLGTGITLGIIAGVAALALAYDKLTESSRKAREDIDKLNKTLDESAHKRIDILITMRTDTATVQAEEKRLRAEVAQLAIAAAPPPVVFGVNPVTSGFASAVATGQREDALKRLGLAQARLNELERQAGDVATENTSQQNSALAALIHGHHAAADEINLARSRITEYQTALANLSAAEQHDAETGVVRTAKQITDAANARVSIQSSLTALQESFKVHAGPSEVEKFLANLEKQARDVASAMKLTADAAKFGHLPTADLSAAPILAVKLFNDLTAAIAASADETNRFKFNLDQSIRAEEKLTVLQAYSAILVDQARKRFGAGEGIVIPAISLGAVRDPISTEFQQRLSDVRQKVKDFINADQGIPLVLVPEFPPSADNRLTADLSTLLDHVKRAKSDALIFDIAVQLGDSGKGIADSIRAAAQKSLAQAQSDAAVALQGVLQSDLSPAAKVAAVKQIEAAVRDLGKAAKDVPAGLGLQAFVTAGRGILDIASGFGNVDSAARKAVRGILDAASALDSFNKAKAANGGKGDILGEISGGLGIAGGIIAGVSGVIHLFTAGDAERKKIQAESNKIIGDNNRHLEELGLRIAGWVGSITDLQKVSGAVAATGTSDSTLQHIRQLAAADTALTGANHTVEPNRAAFDAFLKGTGVSLAQLEAAAHQVGIVLYDSAGRIIPNAFAQLNEAIRLTILDMTTFRNTLGDQRSLTDLHANVFDLKQSPLDIVDSWLDTFKKIAPTGFAQVFGGVDIHNAAAVKKAEQAFVTAVENGTIDLAKLGITKDDFIAIINGMETGFDSVTNSANALSQALRNVPEGFKVAAFEFQAAAVEARRSIAAAPTSGSGPGSAPPTTPFVPRAPQTPTVSAVFTVAAGAIVVYAAPGDDPKKTAAAVFSQLRLVARTTGDPIIQRFVTSLP